MIPFYLGSMYVLKAQGGQQQKWAQTTPDASFGPLVLFFSFVSFFKKIPNYCLLFNLGSIYLLKARGGRRQDGPKRHQTGRLGHQYIFIPFVFFYSI